VGQRSENANLHDGRNRKQRRLLSEAKQCCLDERARFKIEYMEVNAITRHDPARIAEHIQLSLIAAGLNRFTIDD